MLLVLIAVAAALIYIFFDSEYDRAQKNPPGEWLRKKYDPNYSPEQQAEDDLQEVLENAEDYWKEYL